MKTHAVSLRTRLRHALHWRPSRFVLSWIIVILIALVACLGGCAVVLSALIETEEPPLTEQDRETLKRLGELERK